MGLQRYVPAALILLLALLTEPLLQSHAASSRSLPARFSRDAGAAQITAKRPTLLTFHGLVDDFGQGLQPVILHVLIKAKRLPDRSFSVRAVSYVERVALQGKKRDTIATCASGVTLFPVSSHNRIQCYVFSTCPHSLPCDAVMLYCITAFYFPFSARIYLP